MTITLRIIKPQDLPPDQESIISFDTQGGKIGRFSTANDWVLDNNFVSGEHATIEYREDGYYFIDHSSNGTSFQSSDQPAEYFHEEDRKLNDGDILYLGDYDIEVTIEPEDPLPPGPPGGAQETIDAKIPTVTLQIIEPQDLPPEQKSYITFDTQGGTIGLSTDNDWVLADNEHYISGEHATIQYREDGYYIVDRSSNGTSLKSLGQAEAEEFRDEERKLNDGDLLYIDKYGIEVTLEERNEDSIPKPIPKPTGEPPTASTKTRTPTTNTQKDPDEQEKLLSSKRSGDDQDAIAAFLKGAGLTNISIDQLDPDLMRTLGQAFREMMEGIIKLIEARKAFKIGANIEGTRFRAGANNPLKNNRDPSMVLEIMLLKRQGYIPMLDSLQEAFEDIEAHLIGMGSGILTSLENTLERLSPREIEMLVEQEHKKKWFNADSQKWKTYVKHYNDLDFNDLLSDELAQAYEEQIRRLQNQQRGH